MLLDITDFSDEQYRKISSAFYMSIRECYQSLGTEHQKNSLCRVASEVDIMDFSDTQYPKNDGAFYINIREYC